MSDRKRPARQAASNDACLRAALRPFLARSTARAATLFLITLVVYLLAVAGAVGLGPWPLQFACAVVAGGTIASLFVIGHDAAHGAFVAGRRLNALIGRIAFLPSLHNYSLWQVAHNRLHHVDVNVKGLNSWSPLAKAEFDALPWWRRALEHLYRSPLGLGPYYLRERWWRDKFFPRPRHAVGARPVFYADFALLLGWLTACVVLLAIAGAHAGGGPLAAVLWGLVLPFAVWNAMMGATIYLQHTSPQVPWFRSRDDWERASRRQEDLTVHVAVPRWYGLISHHIMDHPAHHVLPKIPLYNLDAAQRRLNELLGDRAVMARFTPGYLLTTTRRCKLYDYERHRWLGFDGRPTSEPLLA